MSCSMYKSVSAFAPITNPTQCPWGHKAFTAYLGSVEAGKAHDATELIQSYTGPKVPMLIDQGAADQFLAEQLKPENFAAACAKVGQPLTLRMQPGFDHSYYFINSFIKDHVEFHATQMGLVARMEPVKEVSTIFANLEGVD